MSYDDYKEHNKLASKLVAHERMLAHLFSPQLKGLSAAQLKTLEDALSAPPTMPSFGDGIDIGTADDLAGMVLDYRDAMTRIFRLALPGAGEAAG